MGAQDDLNLLDYSRSNILPEVLRGRNEDLVTITQFVEKSQYDEIPKIVRSWHDLSLPGDFSELYSLGETLANSALIRNPQKCYAILERISAFLLEKQNSFHFE
jgi:hypothetical protein